MSLSITDVEKIANLARLQLSEAQKELYLGQLSAILAYAATLNELDLDGVEPTTSAVRRHTVMRADEVEASLSNDRALANAQNQEDGQFLVQAILDHD